MINCTTTNVIKNCNTSLSIDYVSSILTEPDKTKLSTIPPGMFLVVFGRGWSRDHTSGGQLWW